MIIEPIIAHTHSNRWWYAPLKLVCDLPSNTEEEEKKNRKEIKEKKNYFYFQYMFYKVISYNYNVLKIIIKSSIFDQYILG